jgi:hypothetical protein
MTTLVLHIGSPKAGSSTIQASFGAARWDRHWCALPANPYGKPYPSGLIAGLYLEPKAFPRFLAQRQHQDPDRFNRDLERYRLLLRQALRPRWRARPQGAVLSCEYLWRLPPDGLSRLRADLQGWGITRFVVVAYVREPVALFGSALQQWARLSTDLQRFDPGRWRYELRQRLETWAAVFPGDLVVRPFDRVQLRHGCVVADLQDQLRQRLADLPALPELKAVPAVNRSASSEELVAMQELMLRQPGGDGRTTSERARALTRLWEMLEQQVQQKGTPIQVRPAVQALIRRRHQDDLDWLSAHYGVHLPEPPASDASGSEISGGTDQLCTLPGLLEDCGQPELLEALRARLSAVKLPSA